MSADTSAPTPNHRELSSEAFDRRVATLRERYADCDLCAHACRVDRTAGEPGACRVDDTVSVSGYAPHFGEESCLTGRGGSGTIFLANCNLACVFCQNAETSHEGRGDPATPAEIAEMALSLEARGCHNVNFVTPTHHAPDLVEAVGIASDRGLDVPIVWNCGGYERAEVLAELEGVVDVYMPDVKWADDDAAVTYSKAPDYWETVTGSLREMHRQVGDLRLEDGIATGGLLVRHLVMPNHVESAERVLAFIAEELSRDTVVTLLSQYRPCHEAGREDQYAEIGRRITREEYRAVVDRAREVGLERLYLDESMLEAPYPGGV